MKISQRLERAQALLADSEKELAHELNGIIDLVLLIERNDDDELLKEATEFLAKNGIKAKRV